MSANDELQAHTCEKLMEETISKMETVTLTEQWKNGELESGVYYIKYRGAYKVDQWHGYYWEDSWSENIEEVLAPVPSYEEWQKMKEQRDACAWALDKIGDVLVQHNLVKK